MKKLLLSLAVCAAVLNASASDTWQLGSNEYSADTLFHVTAGPGVTTTGIRLSSKDGVNQTNIFYSTIDLTNPDLELRGVQAQDNGDVTENVNAMGVRKNGQGNGQYIAGVNGDFFNMGGSPTRTCGHSLVDGVLYNTGTDEGGWWTYAVVEGKKDVRLLQNVNVTKSFKFPNGQTHSYYINSGRWDNYLVIYTPDYGETTGTNTWGRECTMKLVSGAIGTNDAVFEVTSEVVGNTAIGAGFGNMAIPADGFVLSGVGDAYTMMGQLKIGDQVSLTNPVTYNDKEINPTQMIGGCSYIVIDGEIAPDSYFSSSIIDHFTSNQARTVIGYNEDRSKLIILVADKYTSSQYTTTNAEKQTYGTSTGMVLQRMGHIMLHLGCYTAMNFDGGGSSQLYNKEVGICNTPYGADYLRPVANGFFAVSTTPVDNEIASLEVRQKNVKLAEGETYTPTVYGYNKYGVLVNKDVTDYTFTVTPKLGTVEGTTFTAGATKGATIAVVTSGNAKCGVRILTNGGGDYVTSGDDEAPIMVGQAYESENPMGRVEKDNNSISLTADWSFVNTAYNDGWDGTAPNWASEDAIKAKPCPRFATARNGRFYTVDMTTMSIAEIDSEGNVTPRYKLPSLEGRVINDVPDYYGCAISSDDAGHFLIGHLFTKNDTYRIWTIYDPVSGKAKHFDIELPAGEGSSGRIDNIGRVIGDLTKEAYAYVAPKATGSELTQKALLISFKGDGDVDNVTATPTMSKSLYLAGSGNTCSTIQPKYKTVTEMEGKDINETFYWYSKAAGVGQYVMDLFTFENGTYSTNYCLDWNNYSGLNGFDTFTLAGKRYFVVAYSDGSEKTHNQRIVVMDEQSNRVAEWNNEAYTSGAGYNTITAIPVNENKVKIYVYNCTGDYYVDDTKTGAIAGALLTLKYEDGFVDNREEYDITPLGLNFDENYEDGDIFKIYSTETNGAWSGPADFYNVSHPSAFEDHGQLTSIMFRGQSSDINNQANVDASIQPMVTVRKINEHIGKALVINEQYSPLASLHSDWAASSFKGYQPQFSFFVNNHDIKQDTDKKHYVRVRLVYNVLFRGCHYAADIAADKSVDVVKSIYATHEGNWVVPENDHEVGALYAETGETFAKWVGETGLEEDIPDNPVVYVPEQGEIEPYDPTHGEVSDTHIVPYLINSERFRVYEFDTYIDNPSAKTISVQLNLHDRNISYVIKEIKFTDLGTDESAATLLGKRQLGWKYYNSGKASGIEDIEIEDDIVEADDDAPAVYYNLQGVQVVNPAKGIYIVRRGNKVTKEYIR